jgi:hypothetical protein
LREADDQSFANTFAEARLEVQLPAASRVYSWAEE